MGQSEVCCGLVGRQQLAFTPTGARWPDFLPSRFLGVRISGWPALLLLACFLPS